MSVKYADVEDANAYFYNKVLLVRALPALLHDKFGQQKPLPSKNTKTMKFRKFTALGLATTPLVEGITPAGRSIAQTLIDVTVQQYGDFVEVTDVMDWASRDSVLTEIATLLGEQAGQTLDVIYRDVLVAGTNKFYQNGSARTDVNTALTDTPMIATMRLLANNNAKFFTRMVKASDGVGTLPIRAAYWAIVHPDVQIPTLEAITGFLHRSAYPSSQDAMDPYEIGAFKNIRFVSTTFAKVFADAGGAKGSMKSTTGTSADVYATLVFAKDAYAIVPMTGHSMENIRKPLGSAGAADPLNQRGTSGWKAMTACKIMDDANMVRIESAATA